MERLTKPNTVYCKDICDGAKACDGNHDPFDLQCAYAMVYDRLAAYEDTGLEPRECETIAKSYPKLFDMVDELERYKKAEQEGRLVVLPCKVGDVLWRVETVCYADKCPPYADDCNHCTRKKEKVISPIKMLSQSNIFEWSKNLGVDLFLTRAEAEAAMKGVSEDA